ncbi:sigma-70 family RNA polymerase sigma factor [Streptomyces luteireticuli]|uniref:sigma-70 family RNA polymerase sigma factor n=1 Tax=Streptomyces luteireticuli TaxID=173858 RepID=UPI003556882C
MDRIVARPASPQVEPLSAGSAERLDRLFRLYSGRVLACAGTRAKRPADAADIAGDAWVLACRYINGLRADDDHAMPWLMSVVRTAARNHYRLKRTTEQPRDWTDAVASRQLPAVPPADESADVLVLAELTVPEARVLKLAAQGLSQAAIGARLGRHKGTVSRQLYSAARKLRAQDDRPVLPLRPTPHERDGREPVPAPVCPHSRALAALAG